MDAIRVRTSRVSTPGRRAPRARGGAGGPAGAGEGRTHPDDDGAAAEGPRGGGLMSQTSSSLSLMAQRTTTTTSATLHQLSVRVDSHSPRW